MAPQHERKLAAIVAADVAGFSLLMGADEDATLAALKAHRNAIEPVIFGHGGRIVKSMGDGLLIEYPTVGAAVDASLKSQAIMAERDATVPDSRRMQFRIGVHVGEVMIDGDDIYGDSVNVAARLQELAEPGGVVLSAAAHDAAHSGIDAAMVDLGPQSLKNIAAPVGVWRLDPASAPQTPSPAAVRQRQALASAVAVLPFENISDDPAQEYFTDGVTEDLITALSLNRNIRVIAHNSSFAYKHRPRDVRLIAAELDARYILEGSVRKTAERVRVTAQLIDATNGQHMWAEKYDRALTDIFALQDDITENIVARVAPTLRLSEIERTHHRPAADLATWDNYHRILYHYRRPSPQDYAEALRLCEEIRARDPDFAPAYYLASLITYFGALARLVKSSAVVWNKMVADAEHAVAIAGDDFQAHGVLSTAYAFAGNHDGALHHGRITVDMNPYSPWAATPLGLANWISGNHHEALDILERCWRLGNADPDRFHWAAISGFANYQLRNYDAALSWSNQCLMLWPMHVQAIGCKAAALAQLGRNDEAAAAIDLFQTFLPGMSAGRHVRNFRWKRQDEIEHYREGLVKAGMAP